MEDADFSDDFCRFIQTAIPAVEAAELLLLLHASPEAWCSPAEAVARLRSSASITDTECARYLDLFQARGLLAEGPDRRIQYRPANESIARQVQTLAQAYKERPVTLIRMIYALRDSRVQSFADAFNLRRK